MHDEHEIGQTTAMHLYIFGAGASAAEGAPATRDLLPRAWELLGPAFEEPVRAVWRFLEESFKVSLSGPSDFACLPAVDEVISLVDWCLQSDQGLGREYDLPRLYQVRRNLESLLMATLQKALSNPAALAKPRSGPHAVFARALASPQLSGKWAILSLNYDTLLDDALTQEGLMPDYGLGVGAISASKAPLLAKLHGSLNWVLCPACGQIAVNLPLSDRLSNSRETPHCPHCGGGQMRALIISPTWRKSYGGSPLQAVWERAFHTLRAAQRIVFIGYSLPPADLPVYQLIRRALLCAPSGQPQPGIEVIEHHACRATRTERDWKERQVHDRFTRLFGAGVQFDFSGFRGQVQSLNATE